jgi:FtsH-binding integral membrane protein
MKITNRHIWFLLASLIMITLESFVFYIVVNYLDLDPNSFWRFFFWGLLGLSLAIIWHFTGLLEKGDVSHL